MKKLSLKSKFPDEDGMFFHNKVFRCMHGFLRKTQTKMQLGISEARDELFFYAPEEQLINFLAQADIQQMIARNIYSDEISECSDCEQILLRVNYFSPRKKAVKKLAHLNKRFEHIDEEKSDGKVSLGDFVTHYEARLKESTRLTKSTVYFIAKKDGQNVSIFAERKLGNPKQTSPNSYGLAKRDTPNGH
ncbi:hypothetical protein ACFO4O_12405 [Glaciecola siphonariae]|uniref:Uncharacterized protein n=1 Tax=Glaciecola siphonariae TaxID=521012 RepID=A0ABV9LYK0_9ALTE